MVMSDRSKSMYTLWRTIQALRGHRYVAVPLSCLNVSYREPRMHMLALTHLCRMVNVGIHPCNGINAWLCYLCLLTHFFNEQISPLLLFPT